MKINLTKRLFVLTSILTLVLLLPDIALSAPVPLDVNSGVILAQSAKYSSAFSELNLTPQHRQQLQAVRHRRDIEIQAVLTSSQRSKFAHNLKLGKSFNQSLETLNLKPEQRDLVRTILQLSNLKMKAISSRFPVYKAQK
ncbi:hypothetical protein NIES4074_15070 [Cylindrospermum sp. NIES-4074]|nr:hypothetical protein NIES4074_15070 [Cylindrospermum sp. NIES-4074]